MGAQETPEEQNMRLAVELLDNNKSVLGEILRLHGPAITEALHATFTKRLHVLRYEDIEDVVSIALNRLWEARATYNDKDQSLRVWFYCIAQNAANDVHKYGWYKAMRLERSREHDWFEAKLECNTPPRRSSGPELPKGTEKRKASKEAADLEKAVNKLSDEQRRIVMADAASRDGTASNEFLADELGIPAAHVRVYRGRAYESIRKEMKKLGHDIPEPRKDKP